MPGRRGSGDLGGSCGDVLARFAVKEDGVPAGLARMFDPGPSLPPDIVAQVHSTGLFEQPLIWQTFTVVAILAALATCYYRSVRRTRRRYLATAVVAALLAVFTGLNSYVGYVRTPHDMARLLLRGPAWSRTLAHAIAPNVGTGVNPYGAPDEARARRRLLAAQHRGGHADGLRVVTVALPDRALRVPEGTTNVMLPPGYDDPANAHRRYPVVYLVHGFPYGSPDDWFTAGAAVSTMASMLRDHVIPPMIVVGVDMRAGVESTDWECLDVPGGPQLETYLVSSVIPHIDKRFRTVAGKAGRSLGGMSGGAFCALNIGLHHTAMFSSLLLTEPYDTLGDAKRLLNGNQRLIRNNTPLMYLPTMRFASPVAVMIDVPTGAFTDIGTGEHIASMLRHRGQHVAFRKEYGFNHTWHTARAALPFLLAYAAEHFGPRAKVHDQWHAPTAVASGNRSEGEGNK